MISKEDAKDIILDVCHSDPFTANGDLCLTLDELTSFANSTYVYLRSEWYERGKRHGRDEVKAAFRELLDVDRKND